MNLEELKTLRSFVVSRFGNSERWSDDKLPALATEFAYVPLSDAQKAARLLFDEGTQGVPSPSTVKGKARGVAAERVKLENEARRATPDSFARGCKHRWAVLSDVEIRYERERMEARGHKPPEGMRFAICVLCHTESWGTHRTVGEAEVEGVRGAA
jgi:hypothetical protein